ncbi:earmuff [Carabus blaptoides fortunei]
MFNVSVGNYSDLSDADTCKTKEVKRKGVQTNIWQCPGNGPVYNDVFLGQAIVDPGSPSNVGNYVSVGNDSDLSGAGTSKTKEVKSKGVQTKVWKCHVCSKEFAQNYRLVRHLKIHSDQRDYKCTICDKVASLLSSSECVIDRLLIHCPVYRSLSPDVHTLPTQSHTFHIQTSFLFSLQQILSPEFHTDQSPSNP